MPYLFIRVYSCFARLIDPILHSGPLLPTLATWYRNCTARLTMRTTAVRRITHLQHCRQKRKRGSQPHVLNEHFPRSFSTIGTATRTLSLICKMTLSHCHLQIICYRLPLLIAWWWCYERRSHPFGTSTLHGRLVWQRTGSIVPTASVSNLVVSLSHCNTRASEIIIGWQSHRVWEHR